MLPSILKNGGDAIAEYLTDIVNESLQTGNVPTVFKQAIISPLMKSGDPDLAANYRPVSLLPICAKVLERIVLDQITKFFADNGIEHVPDSQFAYRRNHSCEDCLALAVNRWLSALDSNEYCGVIFADMSKAFDRVAHSALIQSLHDTGIRDVALNWFCSYLSDRIQTVRVDQELGQSRPCSRGVPQGSVLGPVLFCIYIRDITPCFRFSQDQEYADDIAFYVRHSDCDTVLERLTADLAALDSYLTGKGLVLNPDKTQFLLLRRPTSPLPTTVSISCRNSTLYPAHTAKYLGLIVDEHLAFDAQVERVCIAVKQKVGAYKHARQNLNHRARRLFYLSIIQSTLEYASSAYINCLSHRSYNQLITASRTSLKRIFALDRRTPTETLYAYTKIYTLEQRLNFKQYVFVFRCLHGLSSPLLSLLFTPRCTGPHSAATTRGQATAALVLPACHSRYGFHSIAYLGADRWNALPPSCRLAESPALFRAHTKSHLGFPVKRQHCLLGNP